MAHVDDGKGGRGSNVELNTVPIIDLMSVLIVFLLMTAVWNQISMIQLGTSIYGKKTQASPVKPKSKNLDVPLRLDIQKSGYKVHLGRRIREFPAKNNIYNKEALHNELNEVKKKYPEKIDIVVFVDDDLSYETLVDGMDVAITEGFPQLSITTGEAL